MVLGITGNIGCGKTTVAKMFEKLGAQVIEADKVGHLLLKRKKVKERLVRAFGRSILDERGEVVRKNLRGIVFKDRKKLTQLNRILHPLMAEEMKKMISSSPRPLIVVDAAVLFEAGWQSLVDKVLVVTSSYETQMRRIKETTNLSLEELEGIMQAQLPQEEKVKRADYVIENEGSLDELESKVKKLWEEVLSCR
ncbi:dephospho-CoA kinase [Candidatus Aerophobetes bacterium]|uniref:Dephospho-CoA kinase n=1 Tax=Aerophobetes bacterium TaxID=2030807 RepID=A0A497E490_UNCAE|nr:MAG: dephospho-CoA kinase [Candidatus Aerophobetes bacterium]